MKSASIRVICGFALFVFRLGDRVAGYSFELKSRADLDPVCNRAAGIDFQDRLRRGGRRVVWTRIG
jgi:hypothetical protein